MEKVLQVEKVSKRFRLTGRRGSPGRCLDAVNKVSFSVNKKQSFGLVGESGCGKTTLAKIITGIVRPDSGSVLINGEYDMVFQDPFGSLNPRMTVRKIIGESLFVRGCRGAKLEKRIVEAMRLVCLSVSDLERYPHEFSGGERQRIAIARAILRRPEILILDEPVSSLDVSIQAEILNLLKDLKEQLELSMVFISHDLRVVEFMSDIVGVMRNGSIVEINSSDNIYKRPVSEYTKKMIEAIPG